MSNLLTVNADGKMLFAIYAEATNRRTGDVRPEIIHCHAVNEGEARWIFAQDADFRKFRIVAVAPAIGFHVADNHGDVLVT